MTDLFAGYGVWDGRWQVCLRVPVANVTLLSPQEAEALAADLIYSAAQVRKIQTEAVTDQGSS